MSTDDDAAAVDEPVVEDEVEEPVEIPADESSGDVAFDPDDPAWSPYSGMTPDIERAQDERADEVEALETWVEAKASEREEAEAKAEDDTTEAEEAQKAIAAAVKEEEEQRAQEAEEAVSEWQETYNIPVPQVNEHQEMVRPENDPTS